MVKLEDDGLAHNFHLPIEKVCWLELSDEKSGNIFPFGMGGAGRDIGEPVQPLSILGPRDPVARGTS